MKLSVMPTLIATAALVATFAPAQADAASPTVLAKTALVNGVKKVDKYAAAHGVPADAKGAKLVGKKAPKGVTVTYTAVTGNKAGYCATSAVAGMNGKLWVHDSWLGKTWRTTVDKAAKAGGACALVSDQLPGGGGGGGEEVKAELKQAVDDAWTVCDGIDSSTSIRVPATPRTRCRTSMPSSADATTPASDAADVDAWTVSDTIDNYYNNEDVDDLPSIVDAAWLAGQGVTLTAGSTVVGYDYYDAEEAAYRFCLVRDSGAWATYDDGAGDIVAKGATGAACTY